MNIVVNPTAEQGLAFCERIKESLVAAIERGSDVEIGFRQHLKEVKSPQYGDMVVDQRYVGATFMAKFQERGF